MLSVDDRISYMAQEPFLLEDTVQHNILFGQTLVPDRFSAVWEAVCLEE